MKLVGTNKRTRKRLARSELWLQLAVTAERWSTYTVDSKDPDEPLTSIARRYDLSQEDVQQLLKGMAQQLEVKAIATGYAEAWL